MQQQPFIEIVSQDKRRDWEDAHDTGIGASEIAAVLGESRYGSRLRVWAEKIGRLERRDLSDIEAVQMGIELEPFVAHKYESRTTRPISKAGTLLRSRAYPWAICTPDYWLCGDDGVWNIPLQIKTTSAYRLSDWAEGPPKEVWWQVQHEMFVTGAPWASVGVLVGGQRFMWADVQRDDAAIEEIIEAGSSTGIFTNKTQSRWSYKPIDGVPATQKSGDHVVTVANKTEFKVLRFSQIKGGS
jgi:putative phage-type endonuclease